MGEAGDANENKVYLNNSKIEGDIRIGYAKNGTANGNGLVIENGSTVVGKVVAGSGSKGATGNFVTIRGKNNLSNANLTGWVYVGVHSGNALNIDNFTGDIASISAFDIINFENLDFTKKEILKITEFVHELENTQIAISSIAGGERY